MSEQSDAAKTHIEDLLRLTYPREDDSILGHPPCPWVVEYRFTSSRKWRFDYAVPALRVAIELDGGTFQSIRSGHSSGVGLRNWREKNNAAMSAGWRVWHYAPEEVIVIRKTKPPRILLERLPWTVRTCP